MHQIIDMRTMVLLLVVVLTILSGCCVQWLLCNCCSWLLLLNVVVGREISWLCVYVHVCVCDTVCVCVYCVCVCLCVCDTVCLCVCVCVTLCCSSETNTEMYKLQARTRLEICKHRVCGGVVADVAVIPIGHSRRSASLSHCQCLVPFTVRIHVSLHTPRHSSKAQIITVLLLSIRKLTGQRTRES